MRDDSADINAVTMRCFRLVSGQQRDEDRRRVLRLVFCACRASRERIRVADLFVPVVVSAAGYTDAHSLAPYLPGANGGTL